MKKKVLCEVARLLKEGTLLPNPNGPTAIFFTDAAGRSRCASLYINRRGQLRVSWKCGIWRRSCRVPVDLLGQ